MATYINPGVYVTINDNPVIATTGAVPSNVCIIGDAPSSQDGFDQVSFSNGLIINTLSKGNITTSGGVPAIVVKDSQQNLYSENTDYQIGRYYDETTKVYTTKIAPGGTTVTSTGTITAGWYRISFYLNGSATAYATTAAIAYNANAATVQTAINTALGAVTGWSSLNLSVSVSDVTGGLYIVFSHSSTAVPLNIMTTQINTPSTTVNGSTTGTAVVAAGTLNVASTTGFPSTGTVYVVASGGSFAFNYTGTTATSFTGVTIGSGTASWTISDAAAATSIKGSNTVVGNNSLVNKWVNVTYTYNPPYGNEMKWFSSFEAVQAVYGPPFDKDTGQINSELSLGAWLAFSNGATQIALMAVSKTGATPTPAQYQDAISQMENESNVDVIVPLLDYSSDPSYISYFKSFINGQASNGLLQRLFLSKGQESVWTADSYKNDAAAFNNQRISILAPSAYKITTGQTSTIQQLTINGYFGAAAVGGLYASLPGPEEPLTHKNVNGFYSIPSFITYSAQDYMTMQSAGVLVLKQNSSGNIYIRHGLNTDTSNWLTQEISILAAQDQLYAQIRDALTNANLIGTAYTSHSAGIIAATIQGVLTNAVDTNLIQAYTGLTFTENSGQPVAVNVSFNYSPTFPLNYINVSFGIDPSAGTIQYSTTTSTIITQTGV